MGKATICKTPRGAELALLIAAALLLPQVPSADDDESDVGEITDSSKERLPAVTAFPGYPSIARRERLEGEATVCFTIDKDGRIMRPTLTSSTHKIFEKPAMRAIRHSSFEPLASGARLETPKTCRTYRFRLDPENADYDQDVTQPPAADTPGLPAEAAGNPLQ
ncbi:MAG: energy transducer TonB [Woeseia sp.]